MKKKLTAKIFEIDFARRVIVLNEADAEDLGVRTGSRVRLQSDSKVVTAIVNTTKKLVKRGVLGAFDDVTNKLKLKDGDKVDVEFIEKPHSIQFIKKKLSGEKLTPHEIEDIVRDMVEGRLSDVEIAAFVCSLYTRGMEMDEIEKLTLAMAESGDSLELEGMVFDKHSIGGVPGNKITPLIIPIVAAAGLMIPKTSSRAITSPSGTADMIEVFCPVDLSIEKVKEVVEKTGGCMVWGGAVDLAPADDITINVEYSLGIDPKPLLLASVLSKKKSVNANYVVIDIPVGKGTKVESLEEGEALARQFMDLGARIGIHIECAITYGSQPVGYAIGPGLEAIEALSTLQKGDGPTSLVEKSCGLAGILLELGGVAPRGMGADRAREILRSREAYKKFKEIIAAQGGDPDIKVSDIRVGKYRYVVKSEARGYVADIENHDINLVARASGAPRDKGAGVLLHEKVGKKVEKGQALFTIYAENKNKLDFAKRLSNSLKPMIVESMVLEKVYPHEPIG